MLQYDHEENDQLELLSNTDSEDIFTFNANEIYISEPNDPHDRGFQENFGFNVIKRLHSLVKLATSNVA